MAVKRQRTLGLPLSQSALITQVWIVYSPPPWELVSVLCTPPSLPEASVSVGLMHGAGLLTLADFLLQGPWEWQLVRTLGVPLQGIRCICASGSFQSYEAGSKFCSWGMGDGGESLTPLLLSIYLLFLFLPEAHGRDCVSPLAAVIASRDHSDFLVHQVISKAGLPT